MSRKVNEYAKACKLPVETRAHELPAIFHGCGNASSIFEDFIEIGIDAYNPLEGKAGLDVVDLRRRFGHRRGFCGNMDVVFWAAGNRDELKRSVCVRPPCVDSYSSAI
jgi:uroporphyrinogen-III decarboxylase